MGNPTSTLRYRLLSPNSDLSVRCSSSFLRNVTPAPVFGSHVFVRSFTEIPPEMLSVTIIIFVEFLTLHIVEVDSWVFGLNNAFPKILFINVDFPALVSPAIEMQ